MAKIKSVIRMLRRVNWLKTLYFNFHYFSIKQAIVLPVFIFRNVKLCTMRGIVALSDTPRTGMVRIGQYAVGTLDLKYDRTIWQNNGVIVFNGDAFIGSGTRISVGKKGTLVFGNEFCITGGSAIICNKNISFGNQCLLSWDILIMDTDFHHITNCENNIINEPKPIRFGNHVWVGCRNTILKGVSISSDVIIAAGSKITKDILISNCIVGGTDAGIAVIKKDVNWTI